MFDVSSILFLGGLLLVVGTGLAGIFACRPTSRVVAPSDALRRSTPEELLVEEMAGLHQVVKEREDAAEETRSPHSEARIEIFCDGHAALARMAPRAAIVKVWRELEGHVLHAAADELRTPPVGACVEVSDAWALLRYCNAIGEEDVALLEGLERARNRAAGMAPTSVEPGSAAAFVYVSATFLESINALQEIHEETIKEHLRRAQRGSAAPTFSVMPLTKNQRIVEAENAGRLIITPEVLKQQQRLGKIA